MSVLAASDLAGTLPSGRVVDAVVVAGGVVVLQTAAFGWADMGHYLLPPGCEFECTLRPRLDVEENDVCRLDDVLGSAKQRYAVQLMKVEVSRGILDLGRIDMLLSLLDEEDRAMVGVDYVRLKMEPSHGNMIRLMLMFNYKVTGVKYAGM